MDRWEWVLGQKPRPLTEQLVDEVAKVLASELSGWPLPVAELDLETGGSFAPMLSEQSKKPPEPVYREAFQVARWELQREVEAIDEYLRNRRYLQRGVAESERTALLFISRWLVEKLLTLSEATEGRVKRPALVQCLEAAERRLNLVGASA
jgi:hypothetical protein